MDPTPYLDRLTDDEGLTRGLVEEEAMALLRTLVDKVRAIVAKSSDEGDATQKVEVLCRRARDIGNVMEAMRGGSEAQVREFAMHHRINLPAGKLTAAVVFPTLLAQLGSPGG
ncbi:MAG TPA: hypothetical protein VKE74_34130 [Gemmataceae bacterium]|nr:hypothetical protein [Gemmataceae bacterium]